MQRELITIEGGRPKTRLSLVSAYAVCSLAILMPVRVRLLFTLAINFIYNHLFATGRVILSFVGRRFTGLLIFLTYFAVLGPTSLLARLLRRDYLGTADAGSFFRPKEPPDAGAERLLRPY
ncbi:MAG: hypothetical protein HY748_02870 [Elusimicrobia bacterium]|nr:hypothetical protein [Elusimicrobiota bacterium]